MRRFFDAARASDTLPDIVSWHEWAPNGQNIIGHVQDMTDWLDREGIAYEGISVNEMIIWDEWGQPGSTVANWAALESVGSADSPGGLPVIGAASLRIAIDHL